MTINPLFRWSRGKSNLSDPSDEEMNDYPAPESGAWSDFASLDVYFDSGVHPPGPGPPAFVTLGYAIFQPGATNWRPALSAAGSTWTPGDPVRFWGLRLERLTSVHRGVLAESAAGRGPQLYDLVSAQGAAVALRANGFHGHAEMLSDGREVMHFMDGKDRSLSLRVGEVEFARDLRTEILETLSGCARVTWRWIPRKENLADKAVKHLHKHSMEVARLQGLGSMVTVRRPRSRGFWPF